MKTFETPYVDVVKFNVADILTASTDEAEETTEEYIPPFMGEACLPGS